MAGTRPLFVPPDATEEEMEQMRRAFEDELNALTQELDRKCGLPEIVPAEEMKNKRI